jgi:hypothetical protein
LSAYTQNIAGGLHGLAPQKSTIGVVAKKLGFGKTPAVGGKHEYDIGWINPETDTVAIGKMGTTLNLCRCKSDRTSPRQANLDTP